MVWRSSALTALEGINKAAIHQSDCRHGAARKLRRRVRCEYWLARDEERWLLLEEDEKLDLVRRLPPPLRLTRARLEGMTARERGGGGGGTRDGYAYILKKANSYTSNQETCVYISLWGQREKKVNTLPVVVISLEIVVELKSGAAVVQKREKNDKTWKGASGSKQERSRRREATHLYISPAGRLVVFDLWGLGSPARLISRSQRRNQQFIGDQIQSEETWGPRIHHM